ncbi:hypothetical protein, partial [Xanthomonas sontii]|uniref:hypothetical protein n=1 Tax=Xanthomonas sontii TaxID=2650745 RepID=UPI001A7E9DB8
PRCALRVREPGGIRGRGILPLPRTAHIHVRRPSGFSRLVRRFGREPGKSKATAKATATATAKAAAMATATATATAKAFGE